LLQDKFSALKNNDLWIGGETYGGIFVPQLARKIDQHIINTRKFSQDAWVPKLKGIVVGNGYTYYKYDGLPSFVPMAYYHGIIDDDLHEYLTINCNLTYADVIGTTT
jgi:carboxypeptidase C (cathepsin A)